MNKVEVRLKILDILSGQMHKGPSETLAFANKLEEYVYKDASDKQDAPSDAGKDQGVITQSNKKVPKKKT